MATLDDVLNEIGRHENGGVRAEGPMTQRAIAESDAAVAPAGNPSRLDAVLADCDRYDRRDSEGRSDVHIGWDAMVKKLQEKGHSKESAEKIAGYINKKKFG